MATQNRLSLRGRRAVALCLSSWVTSLAKRRGAEGYFVILQFGDAVVGDLGVDEGEKLSVGDSFEVHQPRVGGLGPIEADCTDFALFTPLDSGTELHQRGNGIQ